MANVTFKQGLKANLPTEATVETLLFTIDTGEIFKGAGLGNPLLSLGSVIYGNADLAALEALEAKDKIVGKIYLTDDNKLYVYSGSTFVLISDSTTIEVAAADVSFDGTASELTATDVQAAIDELVVLIKANEEATTHANQAVLDLLGVEDGELTYDGVKVGSQEWGGFE